MILYRNEDRAYLAWLARHRHGFVLDALRKPTRKRPVMHRAECASVKKSAAKSTHWTTGRHVKACSSDSEELVAWAIEEYGAQPEFCPACAPAGAAPRRETLKPAHLTKLDREVLDCVLESAVIHLDHGDADYELTISELADRLGKSPVRIKAPVLRLIEERLLETDADDLKPRRRIYPTAAALRSLPAFERMSQEELAAELDRLHTQSAQYAMPHQ
jgi:hypothetical protein